MKTNLRNLNWGRGIVRIIGFLFINVWVIYEFVNAEDPVNRLIPWDSGLAVAVKWVLLPTIVVGFYVFGIAYCLFGFKEPRLNWEEGLRRTGIVVGILVLISIFFSFWFITEKIVYALIVVGASLLIWFICKLIGEYLDEGYYSNDDED